MKVTAAPISEHRSPNPALHAGKKGNSTFFGPAAGNETPFFAPRIQTKLTIGQPGDKYEQEADTVADRVVQRLANPGPPVAVQKKCQDCEEKEELQRKEEEEENEAPEVMRKEAEEEEETPPVQTKEKEEEEKPGIMRQAGPEEEEPLQAKAAPEGAAAPSPSLESRLSSAKGAGAPMDKSTRQPMEAAFGQDFGRVRIHTDSGAAQMNRELNARAFTHGRDIYFNAGEYSPGSTEGRRLLAHELVHVGQQGEFNHKLQRQPLVNPPNFIATDNESAYSIGIPRKKIQELETRIQQRQKEPFPARSTRMRLGRVIYSRPITDISHRRITLHALVHIVSGEPNTYENKQFNLLVPLTETLIGKIPHARVRLRFDRDRNVEVGFFGSTSFPVLGVSYNLPYSSSLHALQKRYGVTFVNNPVSARFNGRQRTFQSKAWSEFDIKVLKRVFPLLGNRERDILRGVQLRRLKDDSYQNIAGFYFDNRGNRSINFFNNAIPPPSTRVFWYGPALSNQYFSRAAFTAVHEIGHALESAVSRTGARPPNYLSLFRVAVNKEARRRARSDLKLLPTVNQKLRLRQIPAPPLNFPTDYSRTNWHEFFSESYALFKVNPDFLNTSEFLYLFTFFNTHFVGPTRPTPQPSR